MRAARRVDFPIPPICDRADQCVASVWRSKGIARCHRVVFDALLWQTPWRRLGVHSAGSLDGGHYPPCSRPTSQHGDACTQGRWRKPSRNKPPGPIYIERQRSPTGMPQRQKPQCVARSRALQANERRRSGALQATELGSHLASARKRRKAATVCLKFR